MNKISFFSLYNIILLVKLKMNNYQTKYFIRRDPFIDFIKKTVREEESIEKAFQILNELLEGKKKYKKRTL
jgi:hypothetical protein